VTVRLLHGADAHAGLANLGRPADEVGRSLLRFAERAVDLSVDLAVWSGDTFHSRRPGPTEIRQALAAIGVLRRNAIPLVIGTGNHDGYGTVADPESHTLAWLSDLELDGVYCLTRREVQPIPTVSGTIRVGHLPYPHKRTFDAETPEEQVRLASAWANGQVERLAEDGAELLVAHVSVAGSRLGSETAMQLGWDTMIDPVVLEPFRYVALGHVHLQQEITPNAWYAGSPEYLSFGEEGHAKGWLLVDIGAAGIDRITTVPSATRQLVTIDVADSGLVVPALPAGSIVRVRLAEELSRDRNESRRVVDAVRATGASYVKVEVVPSPVTTRSRLPGGGAIDADPVALLRRWLELNGHESDLAVSIGAEIVHSARNDD
jgi:DNA repair protein SbcD/Mre11